MFFDPHPLNSGGYGLSGTLPDKKKEICPNIFFREAILLIVGPFFTIFPVRPRSLFLSYIFALRFQPSGPKSAFSANNKLHLKSGHLKMAFSALCRQDGAFPVYRGVRKIRSGKLALSNLKAWKGFRRFASSFLLEYPSEGLLVQALWNFGGPVV